jgi:hypothetical protein
MDTRGMDRAGPHFPAGNLIGKYWINPENRRSRGFIVMPVILRNIPERIRRFSHVLPGCHSTIPARRVNKEKFL